MMIKPIWLVNSDEPIIIMITLENVSIQNSSGSNKSVSLVVVSNDCYLSINDLHLSVQRWPRLDSCCASVSFFFVLLWCNYFYRHTSMLSVSTLYTATIPVYIDRILSTLRPRMQENTRNNMIKNNENATGVQIKPAMYHRSLATGDRE